MRSMTRGKKIIYALIVVIVIFLIIAFFLRPVSLCPCCTHMSSKEAFLAELRAWLAFSSLPDKPINLNNTDLTAVTYHLPKKLKLDAKLIPNEYKKYLYYSPNGFIDENGNKWHFIYKEKDRNNVIFTAIGLKKNGDIANATIRNDKVLIKQIEASKPAAFSEAGNASSKGTRSSCDKNN